MHASSPGRQQQCTPAPWLITTTYVSEDTPTHTPQTCVQCLLLLGAEEYGYMPTPDRQGSARGLGAKPLGNKQKLSSAWKYSHASQGLLCYFSTKQPDARA